MKNVMISAVFMLFSGTAQAADFSALQTLTPRELLLADLPAVPAPSPVKTGRGFRVTDNAPLLAEFSNSFDYIFNGQPHFRYSLDDLRFYRLTGWPRRLLVQAQDPSLPNFHNFTVFSLTPLSETAFSAVYRYNSQSVSEPYDASTLPERVCSLDPACGRWNTLKKAEEVKARTGIPSWETYYFEALKTALLKRIETHYASEKFTRLGQAETAAAAARFGKILQRTAPGSGGRAALLAANEAEWKTELCGATTLELMERLRNATPEEQDRIILRCGFVLDADWIIKQEYEDLAVEQLNGACVKGGEAPVNADYCPVYKSRLQSYTFMTGMEELRLSGGRLKI